MQNDDMQIGRLLSRREVLALIGASSAAALAGNVFAEDAAAVQMPGCVARPEQTQGPYFVDERLNRSDIRSDPGGAVKAGLPLVVALNVSRMTREGCTPISGAVVDLWQCDAAGSYSDVRDQNFNTIGQKFLRGYQATDAQGVARFTTIYPGWYPSRAVHIHFKIRRAPSEARGFEFTSQLYFDERVTDRVYAREPYSSRQHGRRKNDADGIFRNGGRQLILPIVEKDGACSATFNIGLQV